MPVRLVDFHCHLDLYRDHEQLIRECDAGEIATLAVTTTPRAWARNRKLAATSSHVRVALGLHPQLIAERASEIDLLIELLPEARYVGEIGLDAGPRHHKSLPEQEAVFRRLLRACGEAGDKILTIHSVRAAKRVLDAIEADLPPGRCGVVLHWFTGSPREARRAVELGCYFSINAEMLNAPRGRNLVAGLPMDRILTETDGPFVERDGRPVRPTEVYAAVHGLAAVHGTSPAALAQQVIRNLKTLTNWP